MEVIIFITAHWRIIFSEGNIPKKAMRVHGPRQQLADDGGDGVGGGGGELRVPQHVEQLGP